ncbi:DUF2334 domain-containing protein [Tissierella creatinini]|nr:DUF2334 domain-containing protein [Tissierella creatinini]TJX69145.1 DUF2334 domain-containing protein [Soehngenia saccharolytica]
MKFLIVSRKTLGIIAIALGVLVVVLLIFAFSFNSKDVFKEDIYYKGTSKDKVIAFVCNVDWGNEFILPMLEILKERDIHISFFPTGRWAENNPEIVKKISYMGHEIGNHGYSHRDYSKLTYEENKEEISKANTILEEITGQSPKYFGPPSGAYNEYTLKASKDLNNKFVLWSIDTIDWREDANSDLITKRVMEKTENSAIVLMHPTENTVKALPEIINYLFQNGYKIGTISDVIS